MKRSKGEEDDEVSESEEPQLKRQALESNNSNQPKKCPYLDTIARSKLDFDQARLCSVTLTGLSVYACLVCGRYLRGRGKETPAYTHSLQAGHHVFAHLGSARVYCLPEGYEVIDAALNDVKR